MGQNLLAIYGASCFGREVMPRVRQQPTQVGLSTERLAFADATTGPGQVNG